VEGTITRRILIIDGPPTHHEGWDTIPIRAGRYDRAMRQAVDHAVGSGQPWIFWLEDDFTFNQPINLNHMSNILEQNAHLAQLSLLRQPWYPHEQEAGGIIEANPQAFTQRDGWIEHAAYWTQNPMLTRREVLARDWPRGPNSERRFGELVFAEGKTCGILGRLDDPPRVTHIGHTKAGVGY
jgi:hypothetical protein